MTTANFFTSLMSILRTSLKRRKSTHPKPEQLADTCSQCHRLLDSVPSSSALDILWITDGSVDPHIEVDIYGFLMRAVKMHHAQVTVVTPERTHTLDQWIEASYAHVYVRLYKYNLLDNIEYSDLEKRAGAVKDDLKLLNVHVVWRGSLRIKTTDSPYSSSQEAVNLRLGGISIIRDAEGGGLTRPLHLLSALSGKGKSSGNYVSQYPQTSGPVPDALMCCDELEVIEVVSTKAIPKFLFSANAFRVEYSALFPETLNFFQRWMNPQQALPGTLGPVALIAVPRWNTRSAFTTTQKWRDVITKADSQSQTQANFFDAPVDELPSTPLIFYTYGNDKLYASSLIVPSKDLRLELFQNLSAPSVSLVPSADDIANATRNILPKLASVPVYYNGYQFQQEQAEIGLVEIHAMQDVDSGDASVFAMSATTAKQQKLNDRQKKFVVVDLRSPTKAPKTSARPSPAAPASAPKRRKLNEEFGVPISIEPNNAEDFKETGVGPLSLSREFAMVASQASDTVKPVAATPKRNLRSQAPLALNYSPQSSQPSNGAVDTDDDVEMDDQSDDDNIDVQAHVGASVYSPPRSLKSRQSTRRRPRQDDEDIDDAMFEHDLSDEIENDLEDATEDTGSILFGKLTLSPEQAQVAQRQAQLSFNNTRSVPSSKIDAEVKLAAEKIRNLEMLFSRDSAEVSTSQRPPLSRSSSNQAVLDQLLNPLKRSGSHTTASSILMPTQMAVESDFARSSLAHDGASVSTRTGPQSAPKRLLRAKTSDALPRDNQSMPAFEVQGGTQRRRNPNASVPEDSSSQPLPSGRTSPRKSNAKVDEKSNEKSNVARLWSLVYARTLQDFEKTHPSFQDASSKLFKICKHFLDADKSLYSPDLSKSAIQSVVRDQAPSLFARIKGTAASQ